MTELQASRTLVKSPPELWAECSDAASLARHLGRFGEIRITRLEPETAVAWEGERARGTVRIEPAGWGTKVILTAVAVAVDGGAPPAPPIEEPEPVEAVVATEPVEAVVETEPVQTPERVEEPEPVAADAAPARQRRFARLRAFLRGREPAADVPGVAPPPEAMTIDSPGPVPSPGASTPDPPAPDPPRPDPVPDGVSHAEAALAAALDSLGQAHHRPYSRA